jgi:putative DNA primase/helicase
LMQPDPADLISLGTDVNYNPDAPRERFESFLREVFDDDEELISFVKRAKGSCITGDTRDRVVFVEFGLNKNGKSTLNHAIGQVAGDFFHTAPIRVVMRSKQSEIPNEIAALRGKRFVVVAETADQHKLDEARVKALTGRDRIPARFLHQEWFDFEPTHKLVLYTNAKPRVDGSDNAIWDRIRVIPYPVCFEGREDPGLREKLEAEKEGILAWTVEGCLEWQKEGLGTCNAVERATKEYRLEEDTLGRFIATCTEPGGEVDRNGLYEAYVAFCAAEGEENPLNKSHLGRALKKRKLIEEPTETDRKKSVYRGLNLRPEPKSEQPSLAVLGRSNFSSIETLHGEKPETPRECRGDEANGVPVPLVALALSDAELDAARAEVDALMLELEEASA